ncbi:hypothetical protein [Actinomycetospora soli]|uniref:hypothetical protein n=1 Tax=Actinomycetospora soli TaxID=2893887 RepID=UPI001E5CFA50|nr:hypothetical protein [Actinomycetospora soli]MCD2187758.1 hypothetical protein [Actinomycetospora soli]
MTTTNTWGRWSAEDEAADAVTVELAIPAPRRAAPFAHRPVPMSVRPAAVPLLPAGGVAVPPGPPVPPVPPANPLATAGFTVALVGAVLALLPVVGVVSWLLCPVGLGLSVAGVVAARSRSDVGRGLGIAGVVLGVVGLLVCTLYALFFVAMASTPVAAPVVPTAPSPVVVTSPVPGDAVDVVDEVPTFSAPVPTVPSVRSTSSAAVPSTSVRVPTTTARAAVPAGSLGAGTYAVGGRIAPGTWSTEGGEFCTWSRLTEADGEFDSFIAGGAAPGPTTMVVKASDAYVQFSGSCTWSRN